MSEYSTATHGISKQQFICSKCKHNGSVYELKSEFILVPNIIGPKVCSSRLVTKCPSCDSNKITFVPVENGAGKTE